MGCECEAPKICILCSVTHVKGAAKKHCLEINCVDKTAKCPWCRVDMDVTDIYDNADIRHHVTGRSPLRTDIHPRIDDADARGVDDAARGGAWLCGQ